MRHLRLLCWVVLLAVACIPNAGSSSRRQPPVPRFMRTAKPSVKDVRDCARFYGLSHPDIVAAQSVLETGHYRSDLCIKHKNLFGLYDAKRGRYRHYSSWQQSVKAYKQLVGRKYIKGDYYAFLKRIGYAEDPLYCQKLKRVKKGLKL